MTEQQKWVSVFSRDPRMDEEWGFLFFAHNDCAEEWARHNAADDRDLALQVTAAVATDGVCEFCSDLSHEERQSRRQKMFDSGEIHMPVA